MNNYKVIKIDEDDESVPENIIKIQENYLLETSGKIWDSSQILGKYLIKQAYFGNLHLKNQNILELGCGTGILGLLLANQGANLLITDLGVVDGLCDNNIKTNKHIIKGSIKFRQLDWNQSDNKTFNITLDGFNTNLIVASDPIYNEKTFEQFFNILSILYSQINVITYLAYKKRDKLIDKQIILKIEEIGCWYKLIDKSDLDDQWYSPQIDVYKIGKF